MRVHAKEMRNAPTRAEARIWHWLRDRRFTGHKFRRQYPIGSYILDFYCAELKLAIERDGSHHGTVWMAEYECARTEFLRARGIDLLRIANEELIRDSQTVAERIQYAMTQRAR